SIAENPIAAPPAAFPPSPTTWARRRPVLRQAQEPLAEGGPGGEGHPSIAENPIAATPAAALAACTALLHLSQALASITTPVRLWVVTAGAQRVGEEAVVSLEGMALGASLWAFGRTLALEEPQLACRLLDLDPADGLDGQVETLLAEVQHASSTLQVAWRGMLRWGATVAPWPATPGYAPHAAQRLQLERYGALDALRYVPLATPIPGAGEVLVDVAAVGLNLRDLLNCLGLLQEHYAQVLGIQRAQDVGLGLEAAGIVAAVGAGVDGYAVGDRVMGIGGLMGTLATQTLMPANRLAHVPAGMALADAATLPITFLTVWYGLVELASLQPGERVLIHAAAGGVGQAAVQIAQMRGATVFATASPNKWPLLRQQGVQHCFHSRTLDFAQEILDATGGQGVDVVLNSLNGEFIAASFAALRHGGRFVEIGKREIWSLAEAAERRPDAGYFPFDLLEVLASDAALGPRLWQELLGHVAAGRLRSLPHVCYSADAVLPALRMMQQGGHVGKLVITFAPSAPLRLDPQASYLITGGVGALGLQTAQQLVADGARRLVLSSRRTELSAAQQQAVAELEAAGATVAVVGADVGEGDAVQHLLDRCAALGPLRGIVHAAGVLDDGMLAAQNATRLAEVMRPKADGAWHLHRLTVGCELDFFVGFSSTTALLGASGQSNYAAANGFLDGLLLARRAQGLAGQSINWGPWSEVGLAVARSAHLQRQNMGMISPAQGRVFFHNILVQKTPQLAVIPTQATPRSKPSRADKRTHLRHELAALPHQASRSRLEAWLRGEISQVIGLAAPHTLDANAGFMDLGIDSLMAVELRNRLAAGLECTLHPTLLFDYPTLESLVVYLIEHVLKPSHPVVPPKAEVRAADEQPELAPHDLLAFIAQEFKDLT
ncbi:MAG: SDR family NAD(P)-dependent oxidoreductase, partial [Candidatus Viridilinea halotolerans]